MIESLNLLCNSALNSWCKPSFAVIMHIDIENSNKFVYYFNELLIQLLQWFFNFLFMASILKLCRLTTEPDAIDVKYVLAHRKELGYGKSALMFKYMVGGLKGTLS